MPPFYFPATAALLLRTRTWMSDIAIGNALRNYAAWDQEWWIKSTRPGNDHYHFIPVPGGWQVTSGPLLDPREDRPAWNRRSSYRTTNDQETGMLTPEETAYQAAQIAAGFGDPYDEENDHVNDTEYAPAVDTTVRVTPRIRELIGRMIASGRDSADIRELAELTGVLLARPIVDETVNAGYVVRHVIDGSPASPGLLKTWWVACESTDEPGSWVTWEACALDGSQAGRLGYNAGHYFQSPTRACRDGLNRRRALADLAKRAGALPDIARLAADEMDSDLHAPHEGRRAARFLRKYFAS